MLVCKQTPRKNVQLVNRPSENTATVARISIFKQFFYHSGSQFSLKRMFVVAVVVVFNLVSHGGADYWIV